MAKIGIRVWILLIILALAVLSISPSFKKGVVIKSVDNNSTAFIEGLRPGMIITLLNGKTIETSEDYVRVVQEEFILKQNNTRISISTDSGEFIYFAEQAPEISVADLPKSRIKLGLDLTGGARALVKPVNATLSAEKISELVDLMNERFNVYGIGDTTVRDVLDLEGNRFVLIEIAGATPDDIETLVAQQGKFEAKVGNKSAFRSEEGDITNVCRNDATCAGVRRCDPAQDGGYICQFDFSITLSPEAAERHALLTGNLTLDPADSRYLSEKLYLYIDEKEVSSLSISSGLRGLRTTEISIQGSEVGATADSANEEARKEMRQLQTILQTGSLPYQLEIVKLDTISPLLGKEFTESLMLLGGIVFLIVSVVIFIKYRRIKLTLGVILTMVSEAILTLGVAAFINWNLDAPSIAGIIAGIGTGVNDQIVIIDESVSNRHVSIKERIKRALFVILGAFFTIIAAMLPLFWAGAQMLRGFAFTTIIGVLAGILITRPAFAEMVRKMEE